MSDKRNATQRIEDLERALVSLYQTCDNMARDLTLIKDAIKLLGNKVDAIRQASNLTDDQVGAIMTENNVNELKDKVQNLVDQKILSVADAATETSFLVGREVNDEGSVVNPRLQFALSALQPELQEKLKGAKVGDSITLQEGKLKYEVLEVYTIKAPEAPQTEEAAVETQQEAAPTEVTTSEAASS